MAGRMYQVAAYDTLAAIATRFLGDASRWPEIAQANGLRYPFISARASERYGPALQTWVVAPNAYGPAPAAYLAPQALQAGAVVILLPDLDAALAPAGALLLFTGPVGQNEQASRVTIASDASGQVFFDPPLSVSYGPGSLVRLFANPDVSGLRVAGPGDWIAIPDNSAAPDSGALGAGATGADGLGIDLAAGPMRTLAFDQNGDLLTVSGLANYDQALQLRLTTRQGTIVRYPDYGLSPQASGLGTETLAAVRAAVMADPRTQTVENLVAVRVDAQTVVVRGQAVAHSGGVVPVAQTGG